MHTGIGALTAFVIAVVSYIIRKIKGRRVR
jgi:hypothetical protein